MQDLPDFLRRLIDNPPAAGGGVHKWIFDVARNLHAHMPAGDIESLMRSRLATCGRPVPDRELRAGIKNAMDYAWQPKGPSNGGAYHPPTPAAAKPPEPDIAKITKLLDEQVGVPDLWEASPLRFDERQTEYLIDQLFPGDPLLCCGKSAAVFKTLPRSVWRNTLQNLSFLVPSPMTARTGLTKDGKVSAHTLDNTGPRRFLVVEFDFAEFARDGKTPTPFRAMLQNMKRRSLTVQDLCANLLLRLNRAIPMTMAVSSGGKSIHGWWFCEGQPDEKVKAFHNYAITLGADPVTWRRSQFVRIPDGTRDNGKEQTVFYFNPYTLPPL